MISYSTNWMGPVSIDWYKKRGLTKEVTKTLTEDSITVKLGKGKAGDIVVFDDVTEYWAGGRIDIYGTGLPFGDELGLPIMHGEDYALFSEWLDNVETTEIWSLKKLVESYETTHPKIRWSADEFSE